jgi:hypothetical protein
VSNGGGVYVNPRITITADLGAPITSVRLDNLTTGKYFLYTGTVAAGTSLIVDPFNFAAWNNGVNDLTNFTGVAPFWWLEVGTNVLYYQGSIGTVKLDYRKRWVS